MTRQQYPKTAEWSLFKLRGFGELLILYGDKGCATIEMNPSMTDTQECYPKLSKKSPFYHETHDVINQLKEYVKGERKKFAVRLDLSSQTPFTQKVLKEVYKIKFGDSLSYGDVAINIRNPNASRAVGGAVGRNPIPIIIPCHRVLAANHRLGGFSAGLQNKRALLAIEKVRYT